MTCRLGRIPYNVLVARLHSRVGSARVIEIERSEPMDFNSNQLKCPDCAILVHLICATDQDDRLEHQVFQCDDCLGMVRFVLKKCPKDAANELATRQ
jgi:hypothetical protein